MSATCWAPGCARAHPGLRRLLLRARVPGLGAAPVAVIAVKLTACIDRHPHRGLAADWLEMMVVQFGAEHEVPRLRPNGLSPAFDVPVDLTPQEHPPFIVLVVVGV